VNGGDLIFREYLHRLERIAQMPVGPRAIEDGVTDVGAARSAAAAAANRLIGLFHADAARRLVGGDYYSEKFPRTRASLRSFHILK
jgi:hypothetical protein